MSGDTSFVQLVGLAATVGLAVLVGFWAASRALASPFVLSCCVGGIMGIIPGTIIFEFLPALNISDVATVLATLGIMAVGFLVAGGFHVLVQSGLPDRHSLQEGQLSSFLLAVVTDDVIEGFTLAFSSALSVRLLLFAATAFIVKNVLEGFTEATVLQWEGKGRRRTWAAGVAAAVAVVLAAAGAWWFIASGGLGDAGRRAMFAAATGALLYVSVFELARNLEWNRTQRLSALVGFVATGAVAAIVG
jgi:zinc transporter ZupT